MAEVKWRMTLDELVFAAKATPNTIEKWAQLGAFGDRWRERRDQGKYRHITRQLSQQAVLMRRLVDAGVGEWAASRIVRDHTLGERGDLVVHRFGVEIKVSRENLP